MARARPQSRSRTTSEASAAPTPAEEPSGLRLGETLRRLALGLIAALIVARSYWPPEDASAGSGRVWIVAVLITAALGIAGAMVSGELRLRVAWTDLALLILIALVALSANSAADKRPALNMVWEWIGLGIAYLLVRNLPRTSGESSALAACLVATAVALAAYGLVQVAIEFPDLHEQYRRNPQLMLARAGLDPNLPEGSPERRHFEDRLLGSNEPFATFALANSLAGVLVGPVVLGLAVALDRLRDREGGSRIPRLLLAALPFGVLLACLILTKSRSAYLGLIAGLLVVAGKSARAVPRRWIVGAGVVLAVVVAVVVAIGAATRQLDLLVLTESTKSLGYRLEYWRATMSLLGDQGTWWSGVGPGNFGRAYLEHKLPQSSESISDPHNLILDVWASSGLGAVLALLAALILGFRDLLGAASPPESLPVESGRRDARGTAGWLLAFGWGGWVLVWLGGWVLNGLGATGPASPLSSIDPFSNPLRWLVLGGAWGLTLLLGGPLWGHRPVPPWGLAGASLAVAVNLLAAGGIAFPSVALALWVPMALGLNLREDRPCGRPRLVGGLGTAFVLAALLSAMAGWFWGAVLAPTLASESRLEQARAALRRRPPDLVAARRLYHEAAEMDRYDPEPWIELALFDLSLIDTRGEVPSEKEVMHIANHLASALEPPRNPASHSVLLQREQVLTALLDRLQGMPLGTTIAQLRDQRLETLRRAARLDPSNSRLRARLAVRLAEAGQLEEAARQGREALRLDDRMPHQEAKLPERDKLETEVQRWAETARARSETGR